MRTMVVKNNARKTDKGNTFTIEILSDLPTADNVKKSIQELQHYPATVGRRSLMDMLAIIEKNNLQIRFVEHTQTDDGLDTWLFICQG